jgi:WD40 repeat protein
VSAASPQTAFGSDKFLRLWDLDTGDVRSIEGADKFLDGVVFTRDGKHIVAGSNDGALFTWEIASGKLLGRTHEHGNPIRAVALSLDGKRLATSSTDGTAVVWQMPDTMVR